MTGDAETDEVIDGTSLTGLMVSAPIGAGVLGLVGSILGRLLGMI